MQKAGDGQNPVHDGAPNGRVNIRVGEEVLNGLQEFHGEEEEDTAGQLRAG